MASSDVINDILIIDRSIICVRRLPYYLSSPNLLADKQYFGRFGRIIRVKSTEQRHKTKYLYDAYIEYENKRDAIKCIVNVDKTILEGELIICTFAHLKFCDSLILGKKCRNPDCFNIHHFNSNANIFPKECLYTVLNFFKDFKSKNFKTRIIGKEK